MLTFNGHEGEPISLTEASEATRKWRDNNPNQIIAAFVGKHTIQPILDLKECEGLRIYFGLDEQGKMKLVICGADANQNDMLELVIDNCSPCPNRCSSANVLNS
jgi:hypothetical protein